MMNLAFPPLLASLVTRLPVAPPSLAFTVAANRLLWPALKDLDWQPLVGRRYAIRVKDLGLSLRFTVTSRGFSPDSGAPELTVTATARDFMLMLSRREDPGKHAPKSLARKFLSEIDSCVMKP